MKPISPRLDNSGTPLNDLLFNALLGFFFLFAIAFLLINAQTKLADINTKAEYIITLTWDHDSDDDIDTWLEDPLGEKMFFRHKEIPMAHLDRDDRGRNTDTLTMGDGSTIEVKVNQEITTIRGFVPGEWTLNIHMFRREGGEGDTDPTNVQVKMEKLNPKVKTVMYKEFVMKNYWEEITVTRFTMTANGEILEWSDLYKKVIRDEGSVGTISRHHTDDDHGTTSSHAYDFDDGESARGVYDSPF